MNDDGFTIDKNVVNTNMVLEDLNILLEHMHRNGARFILMVMAENQTNNKIEALVNTNLILEDFKFITKELEEIIINKIKNNSCNCDKCKQSIEYLVNKYKLGDKK